MNCQLQRTIIVALALTGLILAGCEKEGKKPVQKEETPKEQTFTVGDINVKMAPIPGEWRH